MRYLLFIFILLVSTALSAQNAKIDSLKKVIETTKVDTVKGRSLCRLCDELTRIGEMQSGLNGGLKGLNFSQKRNDKKGVAECLNIIGKHYDLKGQYSLAIYYYQKSRDTYFQIGDSAKATGTINNIGGIHYLQGSYSQAMYYYQQNLKLQERMNQQAGITMTLNNIAIIFFEQGNYPLALDYQLKSLKIKERLGLKNQLPFSFINIGNIYMNVGDDKKALEYFTRSSEICKETGDLTNLAKTNSLIGDIHESKNQYDKALQSYMKTLNIYEKLQNKYEIGVTLFSVARIHKLKKDYAKSLNIYNRSLAICREMNDYSGIKEIYSDLGDLYYLQQNYIEAKRLAGDALRLAEEQNDIQVKMSTTFTLYQADSALGDYKSAFEHHKLYKQYSDSLHNEDKAKEFGRIESKYQFEKEAEEAKRKKEAQAKIEAEQTDRRNNLQYLTIFAGIIGLFAGLVFLGKFKIPVRVMDVAVFAGLLITFEFLLILFDPLFEQYSGGIPFYKLGFNTVVAFAFAPLHGFLEGKLKKRLVKTTG